MAHELGVAEQSCCAVVVRVQKREWFLLQNQKHSVGKLDVFGDVVELQK